MASKEEKSLYDTLNEDRTGVPPAEETFSLEEILAEYGGGRERKILADVERRAAEELEKAAPSEQPPQPAPVPSEQGPAEPEPKQEPAETVPETPAPAPTVDREELRRETLRQAREQMRREEELHREELPRAPHPISMEEVVGRTVDEVMEEQEAGPLLRPRRGLFSRKKLEETEEIYQRPETVPEPENKPEEETIGPEEPFDEAAADCRAAYRRWRSPVLASALISLVATAPLAAEAYGWTVPVWTGDLKLQSIVLLLCLAAVALLCRRVFARGCTLLAEKQCSCELLISLAALAAAGDCAAVLLLPSRTAVAPYAVVSCWALTFAMWGGSRASRGDWEMFRTVSLDDDPPYLVTETERGACKQKGSIPGFYTTAQRTDLVRVWQTVLLPVVLAASVVFAGLSSLGQGRGADFLLNWSAILSAGATFSLPLCWGIPWSRLARHLQKIGCAVAGWSGAERISRRRAMILTDADLFPPGTMQLNGVKVFGEELPKAASYAATLARCAGSGLHRLFDGLLRSECGRYEEADDFSFYEEGGYSANIHGETVLLGTASFMRKMEVRMPGNIHLKTGLFLAVDHQLTAAFAVKYNASENVDYALRMMKRSRITPILAARDPNITPALLKRKFHKGVKVEYPDLTTRVALSEAEQDRGMPRALLLREGLLPYASTVVGSRRLCRAVRRASVLSFFSSAAGLLLSFYLTFSRAYDLIGPLALLVFLLLWTAPVLLMGDWTGRY